MTTVSIDANITGERFYKLIVIGDVGVRNSSRAIKYKCLCDCGNTSYVTRTQLTSGGTRSCGCLQKEVTSQRVKTHGLSNSPEKNSFNEMLRRCYSEKFKHYKNYGGRGIKVCSRWNPSEGGCFENFIEDMGLKPSPDYSLDRIDNDKNYSPDNCKWSTKQEQELNKRKKRGTTSKFRNVSWLKSYSKWEVYCTKDGVRYSGGYFDDEEEAAREADKLKLSLHPHISEKLLNGV